MTGTCLLSSPLPRSSLPSLAHAPAGIQLSCFPDKKTEAPEGQRDPLKSQSE